MLSGVYNKLNTIKSHKEVSSIVGEIERELQQKVNLDNLVVLISKALEDHDRVMWQSPPINYNTHRDRTVRQYLAEWFA